ncbi:hypothetical protein AOT82_2423 [Psychrobacter sp. AntiMn-1]|nr:hypothetical protein AOT82_2423 [Psychrobacter sp. AntiMn-1]
MEIAKTLIKTAQLRFATQQAYKKTSYMLRACYYQCIKHQK